MKPRKDNQSELSFSQEPPIYHIAVIRFGEVISRGSFTELLTTVSFFSLSIEISEPAW